MTAHTDTITKAKDILFEEIGNENGEFADVTIDESRATFNASTSASMTTTEHPVACICMELYSPVCGTNGLDYDNDCWAGCDNAVRDLSHY